MDENFSKVRDYLLELEHQLVYEDEEDGVIVVERWKRKWEEVGEGEGCRKKTITEREVRKGIRWNIMNKQMGVEHGSRKEG